MVSGGACKREVSDDGHGLEQVSKLLWELELVPYPAVGALGQGGEKREGHFGLRVGCVPGKVVRAGHVLAQ